MSDRAAEKRELIIQKARKVFIKKGYKDVTMKDIVEACDISRGGLYIYFDSIKDLFEAVLEAEEGKSDAEISRRLPAVRNTEDVLTLFFKEQKKEILRKQDSLLTAIYEYEFINASKKNPSKNTYQSQIAKSQLFLRKLIETANKSGELRVEDPRQVANHVVYALEGMKIMSRAGKLTEKDVDEELLRLIDVIVG